MRRIVNLTALVEDLQTLQAGMDRSVLVTDGDQRAALAIVRSLGRAGYECKVASARPRSLAAASRYARGEVTLPDPTADPSGYAAAVEETIRREGIHLLLPVTESSILALLAARERIQARLPFPDLATFRAVSDKARVVETARDVGIRTPRQVVARTPQDVLDLDFQFPVVLKPSRSVFTGPDGRRGTVGVRWARSGEEVHAGLQGYPAGAFPVLVQEAVSGPGVGVFVLIHQDRLVASFAHRRIREKPPSGGVSVVRQSEPMDPELLGRSIELLERFGWTGVAMVEYKIDRATGEAVLMEVNGRFWGSLQLAIDAGVDFARLLADTTLGRDVVERHEYRSVRSRWIWGDVDHLIAVWRDADGTNWKDRLSTSISWLRAFGPGYRTEVFRWSDPGPFARETRQWFGSLRKPR